MASVPMGNASPISVSSRSSIRGLKGLQQRGLVGADADSELEGITERYAVAVTEPVAALIAADPDGPVARQYLPTAAEAVSLPDEIVDPIGDGAHSPVRGIVHRYPDRVLLKLTHACPVYCRFCFRREQVGPGGEALGSADLEAALGYIRSHPQIWEVVFSGGDPLYLPPKKLKSVLAEIGAMPHVEVVRFHSRVPVVLPAAIDGAMLAALAGRPACYVAVHINHRDELTAEAVAALRAMTRSGITLLSQTVLLKGINDDPAVLADLFRALVANNVKPYYLHHLDRAPGTSHFRVPLERGQEIVRQLRGRVSGLCQPTYMLDIPGGYGKVPIGPNYVEAVPGGYRVTDPNGGEHAFPDAE
jgi:lysine 2,3-aminomutase